MPKEQNYPIRQLPHPSGGGVGELVYTKTEEEQERDRKKAGKLPLTRMERLLERRKKLGLPTAGAHMTADQAAVLQASLEAEAEGKTIELADGTEVPVDAALEEYREMVEEQMLKQEAAKTTENGE